jgi:hypothetical protein
MVVSAIFFLTIAEGELLILKRINNTQLIWLLLTAIEHACHFCHGGT